MVHFQQGQKLVWSHLIFDKWCASFAYLPLLTISIFLSTADSDIVDTVAAVDIEGIVDMVDVVEAAWNKARL